MDFDEYPTEESNVCPEKKKGTLEFYLRPYRIPMDKLREQHGAVLGMITKLLGVTPRHCQYLSLWPPGYETMSVIVPNLFDIPFCDFSMGSITGALRSITSYVVSRSYGCGYCAAHCANLGTIWLGDGVYLDRNAAAMEPRPDPQLFSPKERAAINIAKKAGPIPCEATTEDMRILGSVFSVKEQEAVINITAVMGFLNKFMDTIGMTLEKAGIEIGTARLASSGWAAGIAFDPDADEELMRDDANETAKQRARERNAGLFTFVTMLFGAKWADRKALGKIPGSDVGIATRCRELAGFVPYYITDVVHSNARHAFAWAFLLRLNEGSENVPVYLKQLMCYICATNTNNTILRAHYAAMAYKNGVTIDRLVAVGKGEDDNPNVGAAEAAALVLAEAASWSPSRMTPTLVGLLSRQFSPAALIELVTTISVWYMFHRWTSIYVPKRYEPEISTFLQTHGQALFIDPDLPCSNEQLRWPEVNQNARTLSASLKTQV